MSSETGGAVAALLAGGNYSLTAGPLESTATVSGSLSLENASSVVDLLAPPDPCTQRLTADYYDLWRDFKFWSLAFVIPVGLVFNFISLGVFMKSWMRHVVSGRYFMGLALADNLVLVGELLLWLNTRDVRRGSKLGVDFHHSVDFFCKFINFLRYGARMWSSWLTVAITIERFLSVIFPFKIMRLSNPTKAVVVVTTVGVICFSLACFTFTTLEAKPYHGGPLCQYTNRLHYSLWLVIVIAGLGEMVLPSVIVSIFTMLIIWKLAAARRERMRMCNGDGRLEDAIGGRRRPKTSEVQPTIALVAIAIVFVSIRMPYVIMFFVNMYKKKIWRCLDKWLAYEVYALYTASMVLAVINYAVNFCLYCVTGRTFRTEMRRCVVHRVTGRRTPHMRSAAVLSRGGSSPLPSVPGTGVGGAGAGAIVLPNWGTRRNFSDGSSGGGGSGGGGTSGRGTASGSGSGGNDDSMASVNIESTVGGGAGGSGGGGGGGGGSVQNGSPPIWSGRARPPAKTLIVRDGNRAVRVVKSKKQRTSTGSCPTSEEQASLVAGKGRCIGGPEQEITTYTSPDTEGRPRVQLKPVDRQELANRHCPDCQPLSGIYDPRTETVFFVPGDARPWRTANRANLNCFSSQNTDNTDFC